MANERRREIEYSIRHGRSVHQISGHDEEGNGGKRRLVDALKYLKRNDVQRIRKFAYGERGEHCGANRHGYRNAQKDEDDESCEQNKCQFKRSLNRRLGTVPARDDLEAQILRRQEN